MSDSGRSSSGPATNALNISRRPLSTVSPARLNQSSEDPTFDLSQDAVIMSTRHDIFDDAQELPKIRATAQKYNMGYYNPPEPQALPPTSAINRQFQDFDQSYSSSDSSSPSVEVGRGLGSRLRQTPSKSEGMPSDLLLSMGNSFHDANNTPPKRARPAAGNLRREAAVRRASTVNVNAHDSDGSTGPGARGQRFGKSSRKPSTPVDSPRTAQSFALPEMPNLTELIAGTHPDGTQIFSAKSRARFSSGNFRAHSQPTFVPVSGIAIPQDEKAILASLELLKDKIAQLEHDKAQSDRRIEDYENEVIDLRAQLDAEANIRRSDSALGSTDGEGGGKEHTLRQEKIKLEASVKSLQDRLNRAEKKTSTAESTTKRIIKERDAVVQQIGVAFYNSEELKNEVDALRNENKILQDQVTDLQTENRELTNENEELRTQLDETHDRHDENTQKWTTKEASLKRKATTVDRDVLQENQTLREELVQLRHRQETDARQATQKEAEVRRKAEKAAQAEHAKLARENEQLKAELDQAQSIREAEMKRWKVKQAELKARVEGKEETIHHLQAAIPQDRVNDELRQQNEELKVQLARHKVAPNAQETGTPKDVLRRRLEEVTLQRDEETQRWSKKENRLRARLDKAREVHDLNRQIHDLRQDAHGAAQAPSASRAPADVQSKRKSTGQISIHDSISEQIDREMQKNRSASAAQPNTSSSRLRSRSKSQSRGHPRQEPPRNLRHSSAPVVQDVEESDQSTTNLSFEQANTGTRRSVYQAPAPVHTGDTTFLSFIDGNEIARLRKKLEEEHALARKRRSGAAAQMGMHRSKANGTRNLTQKSSLKDLTGRSKASTAGGFGDVETDGDSTASEAFEHERQHTKQDTVHSNMSRADSRSQRRRSGNFTEMTSAFIVPDITLQARASSGNLTGRSLLDKLAPLPHDTVACTVCQRIIGTALPDAAIPAPVPVSTRPEVLADVDATLRPTQGPIPALGRVLKELQDELVHLKLELHVVNSKLQQHDPALGKRVRDSLHEKVDVLNKAIKSKSEQIYALYDVVEAHKDELADGLVPDEIERTMESIRVGGKKVNFGAAGSHREQDESEEDSDEAPWAGISDTESLHRR